MVRTYFTKNRIIINPNSIVLGPLTVLLLLQSLLLSSAIRAVALNTMLLFLSFKSLSWETCILRTMQSDIKLINFVLFFWIYYMIWSHECGILWIFLILVDLLLDMRFFHTILNQIPKILLIEFVCTRVLVLCSMLPRFPSISF